jgi:aryl-alcohol dehydrogenase-like predicted oxidoreductase
VRYRRFDPLDRDLSILGLGTAGYEHAPLDGSVELLDAWVELGGNVVDTGRHYGNAETIVGRWLRERTLHEEVVVITKGGHYDVQTGRQRVTARDLSADFATSRRELGLEAIDVYFLHRDDPARPVEAILEDVEPLTRSGQIRALGASNWTTGRLDEAAAYARANGVMPFACSSPGLSLAAPNEEPWPGCVSIHDEAARAWYSRTRMPVFAWSSQAAGFFAGALPEEMKRAYLSDANLERLRRARELASSKGGTPSQVALAWVLHQPFPVHAVIGPRSVPELRESVGALELELSSEELLWLDLA